MNIQEVKKLIEKREQNSKSIIQNNAQKVSQAITNKHSQNKSFSELINKFNQLNSSIDNLCIELPDFYVKEGNRALRIGSKEGAGISFMQDSCTFVSAHDKDPMQQKAYTLFDAICKLKFNDDFKQTILYLYLNKERFSINNKDFPYNPTNKATSSLNNTFLDIRPADEENKGYRFINITKGYPKEKSFEQKFIYYPLCPVSQRYTLLLGESGVGKTSFYTKLIAAYLKGEDFLDMNLVDAYRDKVVVVILTEGDSNNIWNILKKSNIDEKTADRVHLIRWSKFGKYSDNLNEFINCIDNIGIDNIGLVFWDSWLGTEIYNSKNDSEAIREGTKAIQYILENSKTGACAYIIHHFNKNKEQKGRDRSNGSMYLDADGCLTFSLEKQDLNKIILRIENQNISLDFNEEEKWRKGFVIEQQDDYQDYIVQGFGNISMKDSVKDSIQKINSYTQSELESCFSEFKEKNKENPKRLVSAISFLAYLINKENNINYQERSFYDNFAKVINRNYYPVKNKIEDFLKTMTTTTLPL